MSKDEKQVFNPTNYDSLLELATRIGGRCNALANAACAEEDVKYWRSQGVAVRLRVWDVNPYDSEQVQVVKNELIDLFRSLPKVAPEREV